MAPLDLSYALVGVLAVLLAFWSSAIRRAPVSEPLLALLLGAVAGPVLGVLLLAVSLMAVALRFQLRGHRRW